MDPLTHGVASFALQRAFFPRAKFATVAAMLVAVITACGCGDPKWTTAKVTETKERGNAVATALFAYKDKYGAFPADLSAIAPEFMPVVPAPTAGKGKWQLRR